MTRLQDFSDCVAQLKATDPANGEEFGRAFARAVALLEVSNREVADALGVSRPSISRWTTGKSYPHPVMRGFALEWATDQAERKVRILRSRERDDSGFSSTSSATGAGARGSSLPPMAAAARGRD